jgi:hypothetical protein
LQLWSSLKSESHSARFSSTVASFTLKTQPLRAIWKSPSWRFLISTLNSRLSMSVSRPSLVFHSLAAKIAIFL